MNKLLNKTKKGFTLVELLVVIAILAVLASVSVIGYLGFTTKARNSNAMTELAQVREVLRAELIDGNEVSATYESSNTIKMKYTDKTYYISDTSITAEGTTAVDLTTGLKALFTDLSDLSCTLSVTYGAAETVATESEATGYYALTRIDYSRTNGGSAYWLVSNDSVTAGEYSA